MMLSTLLWLLAGGFAGGLLTGVCLTVAYRGTPAPCTCGTFDLGGLCAACGRGL